MESYLLAIDAGGSKTTLVLAAPNGQILRQTKVGGANIHNHVLNLAFSQLADGIKLLELPESEVSYKVFLGLSGFDTPDDAHQIKQLFIQNPQALNVKFETLTIVNDAYLGLASVDVAFGFALILGTGSNCYCVTPDGQVFSSGDWGPLLGDQASGFALGRKFLRRLMREHDGRENKTILTDKILNFLEVASVDQVPSKIYTSTNQVSLVASLTGLLSDPEVIALDFITHALIQTVDAVMASLLACIRKAHFDSNETVPVVLMGGLVKLPVLNSKIIEKIPSLIPHAKMYHLEEEPVFGGIKALLKGVNPPGALVIG